MWFLFCTGPASLSRRGGGKSNFIYKADIVEAAKCFVFRTEE
jgi:hypothetical protein